MGQVQFRGIRMGCPFPPPMIIPTQTQKVHISRITRPMSGTRQVANCIRTTNYGDDDQATRLAALCTPWLATTAPHTILHCRIATTAPHTVLHCRM